MLDFGFGMGRNGNGQRAGAGLIAGTKVATAMGWRPVEALTDSDLVLTFDHGMQPLTGVTRLRRTCRFAAPQDWPVLIPAGVLGNSADAMVMPDQPILIESDLAENMTGDPFVLVTAAALDGCGGIGRVLPDATLDIILLTFAQDQVIFTKAGLTCHCAGEGAARYPILTDGLADDLVADLIAA